MAATDPELKDGLSLPVWMKTKPTKDFEPFTASPPSAEDSFFFIKYPRSEAVFGKQEGAGARVDLEASGGLRSGNYDARERDWSRHTKPCQEVLHGIAPINTAGNSASTKPKPAGTDDGFKGEGAACGTSVLKVVNQMISSGRPSNRGFTVAAPSEDGIEAEARQHYRPARRGSRSLPVSPAHSPPGSPNSRRKNVNRYFTSPFEPSSDAAGARSWLTAALLGFKKELATSTSTLAEEDAVETRLQGSLAESSLAASVERLGPAPPRARPPRPSELRELNFWSPTSM